MKAFLSVSIAAIAFCVAGCKTTIIHCHCPPQHHRDINQPHPQIHSQAMPALRQQQPANKPHPGAPQKFQGPHRWHSSEPAAPDSVEGKLRAQGKRWERSNEPIEKGAYVQDILEGRLHQPIGRGSIGKVVEVKEENGRKTAVVDFGRGYKVPIQFSELDRVRVIDAR